MIGHNTYKIWISAILLSEQIIREFVAVCEQREHCPNTKKLC